MPAPTRDRSSASAGDGKFMRDLAHLSHPPDNMWFATNSKDDTVACNDVPNVSCEQFTAVLTMSSRRHSLDHHSPIVAVGTLMAAVVCTALLSVRLSPRLRGGLS